jgi:hypothetical protein
MIADLRLAFALSRARYWYRPGERERETINLVTFSFSKVDPVASLR